MIDLESEVIALCSDEISNTMQTSNTKKPTCFVIEAIANDDDWALFLEASTRYK